MKINTDTDMLYQIIENLQKIQAPIAIKGGLLLRASLQEHGSDIDRKTVDIDANWLTQTPDISDMENVLRKAVQLSHPNYDVITKRPYGNHQSAGFYITDENGDAVTHIDIDVNKPTTPKTYTINNMTFTGIIKK